MDSNGHGTKTNYDVINQNIPDTNETYDSFTIGSVFYWPENFNEWKKSFSRGKTIGQCILIYIFLITKHDI